jgi:uncharacterized protein
VPRQSPAPDEVDREFWAACNDDRLVIPYCTSCQSFRFPPAGECWVCGSTALEWREVSGRGTIYSYAVIHDTPITQLKEDLPYVVAVIELDDADGVNLVAQLPRASAAKASMDAPVVIEFEATPATGQKVPVARVVAAAL